MTEDHLEQQPPKQELPRNYYKDAFLKQYPTPSFREEDDEKQQLIRAHVEQVLTASNTVRENIESGSYDELSSEKAFHEIHAVHVGEDDPIKHVLATMDLGLLENTSAYSVWYQAIQAIDHLEGDTSYSKGNYRTTPISWGEKGRGVLGMEASDLPDFAKEYFSKIDEVLKQVKAGELPALRQKDNARAFCVAAATVIDIAHFKKDCNGRSSEDFMVWLQRQLLPEGEKLEFLSENGMRARGADLVAKPEYEDMIFEQRKRIDGRSSLVVGVRKFMYEKLARNLKATPDEIQDQMPTFTFDRAVGERMIYIRKKATDVFRDISQFVTDWTQATLPPFNDVVNYYREYGVTHYQKLSPQEVLR